MGKLLLWLSLVSLLFLGVGTHVAADNPMFWMASSEGFYQVLRIALGAIIVFQLMTAPPRNIAFRIIAGFAAVIVGGWAAHHTYNNYMDFLDAAAFMSASMAILATALERNLFDEVYDTLKLEQAETPVSQKA